MKFGQVKCKKLVKLSIRTSVKLSVRTSVKLSVKKLQRKQSVSQSSKDRVTNQSKCSNSLPLEPGMGRIGSVCYRLDLSRRGICYCSEP